VLRSLEQWICDSCGGIIDGAVYGCVEWYVSSYSRMISGFRITHKSRQCTYDAVELALDRKKGTLISLDSVTGPTGLGLLTERLGRSLENGNVERADTLALGEIMRRLQVPFYEEARLAWRLSIEEGVHDGLSFDTDTLLRIIHWKDAAVAAWLAVTTGRDVVPRTLCTAQSPPWSSQ